MTQSFDSTFQIEIYPKSLLQISEHIQSYYINDIDPNTENAKVYTACPGKYKNEQSKVLSLDLDFASKLIVQVAEMNPDYKLLGWYQVSNENYSLQDSVSNFKLASTLFCMLSICNSPILLVIDQKEMERSLIPNSENNLNLEPRMIKPLFYTFVYNEQSNSVISISNVTRTNPHDNIISSEIEFSNASSEKSDTEYSRSMPVIDDFDSDPKKYNVLQEINEFFINNPQITENNLIENDLFDPVR
ncbi:hypothetical protein BB560_003151 [Smittium megazygosporum]|uniref:Uncharacterized protein n=1 Tax=Smittium megazygosporum TaxID=133381 RepID=A0A2T9ZCV0_9FUNG|nr:hypothetical protein BB560_003151 [Smittium megazygosporum]